MRRENTRGTAMCRVERAWVIQGVGAGFAASTAVITSGTLGESFKLHEHQPPPVTQLVSEQKTEQGYEGAPKQSVFLKGWREKRAGEVERGGREVVKRGLGEQGWGEGEVMEAGKLFLKPEPCVRHAAPHTPKPTWLWPQLQFPSVVPINSSNVPGGHPWTQKPHVPETAPTSSPAPLPHPWPRIGLQFFVSPSVGISGWENVIMVNFMEGGVRIETARLFSRKHKISLSDL